ncbi:trimeric LpxA-like protein [Blastocladiella britannica]|nr:trimeric LpxA-like protein [Blastocladiella britannica]
MSDNTSRMLAGKLYYSFDPVMVEARRRAALLMREYNDLIPGDRAGQLRVMRDLFGAGVAHLADEDMPWIEAPFRCDYGTNIRFGKGVYMNFNTCILDCALVTIGDKVLFGPNCSIYSAEHPLSPTARNGTKGPEFARPVSIGHNVWLGGNVVVTSGGSVGDGSMIGAGAVVTRAIPPMSVAVGSPARVVKTLTEVDDVDAHIKAAMQDNSAVDPRFVGLL